MLKLIPTNSNSVSQVYLAQDSKGSFVVLKTVDTQQRSAEESISREIEMLSLATPHLNIVRLLGEILQHSRQQLSCAELNEYLKPSLIL